MSQSVRQKHGVGACGYGLVGIALHQTELLQSLRHQSAYGKVHIHILHTRLGHFEHVVMTFLHDAVNL